MNEENFPDRLTPDEIRQLAIDRAFESKALIQRVEEAVHAKWKKKLSETSRSVSLSPVALNMIREVRDARKAEAGFSIDYQKLTTDIMHAIGRSPSVHKKHLHWEGWPGTWHFANTAVAVVYETVNAALNTASAKSNRYPDLVAIQVYEQGPPLKLVSETRLKPREEDSDK